MPNNPSDRKETLEEHIEAPVSSEELAPADDSVIGRAFRWSLWVLSFLAAVGAAAWIIIKSQQAAPATKVTQLTAPVAPPAPTAEIPEAKFTEFTRSAGITFVHNNGAYGDKLLPETMGGGCAFFDFDNDGDQDLLFINSTYWSWDRREAKMPAPMALYRNDGAGEFEDITAGSGLDVSFYGMGVAAGDYDNDGWVDLFLTAVGPNHLFRNLGNGKFVDAAVQAGVAGTPEQWSTSSAWIDYDNDGDLDLFVCNYVRWSREIDFEVGYKLVGIGRAYGQPTNFEGSFPYLYRNEGNGQFTDVTAASGLQIRNPATGLPMAKSLGVAPVDLDSDGWMDLVVANDTVKNFVFHNQANGSFKEIGALTGIAFDSYGFARGAMGIDAAHYRNDPALGIAIGNFANEMIALYASQNQSVPDSRVPVFNDQAIVEGIGPASRLLLKFGLFFFDYDLDGRLDLLTANGHLEEEIHKIQQSQNYAQPAQLFWNCGPEKSACFALVSSEKAGSDLFHPIVGRGSAFADMDGDGDLDPVLTQIAGPPLLLRNDQNLGHHWVRLKLVGTRSNRDAIGAWVKARLGNEVLQRQVMPTRSYLSQSELPVTIGLGTATKLDELQIRWPSGLIQNVATVPIDTMSIITEPN